MEQKKTTPLDQAAIQGDELMKNPPKNPYEDYRSGILKLIDIGEKKDKELQHDERLAKVHEAVAGLSDAGRAIANLIGTTQGAPNAYADSGLSDKARERVEKARAEREKNRDALLNYAYQESKLNENERSWKHKLRQDRINNRSTRRRLDYLENESRRKEAKQQEEIDYKTKLLSFNEQKEAANRALADKKLSIAQYTAETNRIKANTAKLNAEHGEQGYTMNTTRSYDNMGRLTSVTVVKTPNGEEYKFDADGNVLNNTAPASNSAGGGKASNNSNSMPGVGNKNTGKGSMPGVR